MKFLIQLLYFVLILCVVNSLVAAQEFSTRGMLASFKGQAFARDLTSPTSLPMNPVFGDSLSSLENTPIASVQIRIRTDDRDNAGQDDEVKVRLNREHETWLDSGTDDFERGQTYTYDLVQGNRKGAPALTRLSDIQFLEISKTGNDGWCFSDVELIVNGRTVYTANYPRGQWLDNSGGARLMHKIPGTIMRRGNLWAANHSNVSSIRSNP